MSALERSEVRGSAEAVNAALMLKVEQARPHSLLVSFDQREQLPLHGAVFDRLTLQCAGRRATLGPCRYESGTAIAESSEPAPPSSDGRLVFLEHVYDFTQLFAHGRITELSQRVRQLPLVWGRKSSIQPAFRDFTSQLLYDFQVYRGLFDGLDRSLENEPPEVRTSVHEVAIGAEYENFSAFFDTQLEHLESAVRHFTRQDHERHGFYFRKQLWDIIHASEFLARTNLKPRGYSGDSVMMRMIYQREFRGRSLFSKFMNRHPLDTVAAEAVRHRRQLVADTVRAAQERCAQRDARTRVLSVACGPAWELRDLIKAPRDLEQLELVLLDQDPLALDDARDTVMELEQRFRTRLDARLIKDSVRTMIGATDLASRWGQFDVVYAMGLFDYLTPPVAKAVLGRLYELLAPGGVLTIGNFHARNPSRVYMEYWMDWVIYYRDEAEFLELAGELTSAEVSLTYEATRNQMFLQVRKP
ncbi:MAG: class I SAM-dependent methyltransferase [Archangium sp.]|nr:class I SAM-dependent methyltransferase [Archangium sp.]MDP3571366.1 class I SAM-dependent methyltransferase [Archangium sp.]